jgi:hypothetical protein
MLSPFPNGNSSQTEGYYRRAATAAELIVQSTTEVPPAFASPSYNIDSDIGALHMLNYCSRKTAEGPYANLQPETWPPNHHGMQLLKVRPSNST